MAGARGILCLLPRHEPRTLDYYNFTGELHIISSYRIYHMLTSKAEVIYCNSDVWRRAPGKGYNVGDDQEDEGHSSH